MNLREVSVKFSFELLELKSVKGVGSRPPRELIYAPLAKLTLLALHIGQIKGVYRKSVSNYVTNFIVICIHYYYITLHSKMYFYFL